MSNLAIKDNSLFQEVSVYEEQKLTGGKYWKYLKDLVDVDFDFDIDFDLNIINIIAETGSQTANQKSDLIGATGDITIQV